MPFESEKQRRYLFANEPGLAKRWAKKYGLMPDGRGGAGIKKKVKRKISGKKDYVFGDKAVAGYAYDVDRKRRDPRGNIGASAGFRFGPLRGGVGFGTHGGPVKRKVRTKKTLGPIGTKRTY